MNLDAGQIDRIVKEVMRQLLTRDQSAPALASQDHSAKTIASSPQTLVVADRVVTMQSVAGRLAGVTQVRVPSNAIVTPLVTDALRESGIGLQRGTDGPEAEEKLPLLLVASDVARSRVANLIDRFPGRCESQLDRALATVAACTSANRARALVLSSDWAKVVCQANRNPKLRSASVVNPETVQQAIDQLNANVFVADDQSLSDAQLSGIVSECLKFATASLKTSLKGVK